MAREEHAPGRLDGRDPVAIIDIGSNSIRLVIYEGARRSPTPIFNEKVLAGLGRIIATTGRLDEEAMARTLAALSRFRALADQLGAGERHVIATAAAREAENGADFINRCEEVCGVPIRVLSGASEAHLSALGVVSGFMEPDGIAADLGGGSLEIVRVSGTEVGEGATLPLGGLRLADITGGDPAKARKLVKEALREHPVLVDGGPNVYAIGGTFRALANLHMAQRGYALHVIHHYQIAAREALDFCRLVRRADPMALSGIESVSSARRPLLVYGAMVLENLIKAAHPKRVLLSALGVREGLLYDLLDEEERARDPMLAASEELAFLRSRSPGHVRELVEWTDQIFGGEDLPETEYEAKLRQAACLLADIAWRAHPDYRGEQSLNIIAHAPFIGIDHPGRAFVSLAVYYRHVGLVDEHMAPRIREVASMRLLDRARLLGAAFRVAYLISAAAPGIISSTPLHLTRKKLTLTLPGCYAALHGERLENRVRSLARLLGREPEIVTE